MFLKESDFSFAEFVNAADFREVKLNDYANFFVTKFNKDAVFDKTTFTKVARFECVTFMERTLFRETKFIERANFNNAEFAGPADFSFSEFSQDADFNRIIFSSLTHFRGTVFSVKANFKEARFYERTIFASYKKNAESREIFHDASVDFNEVIIQPPDMLSLRDADLRKCRFLGTDLRRAEITGARWPKIKDYPCDYRFGVYDEIVPLSENEVRDWSGVEQTYRQLKQNYEDRRDYERAGDFHYGERQMHRKNPETRSGLYVFLTLYWFISGYGERYLRPLVMATALLVLSAASYYCGFQPEGHSSNQILVGHRYFSECLLYSLRVMAFLKPDDLGSLSFFAKLVNTVQSILGPVLIGFFALALRQRLKR